MFEHLNVTLEMDGRLALIRLEHGKANEVGSGVLAELERLPGWFRERGVLAALTYSERRSSRGTPIFVAGADVTERTGWDDGRVKRHVRWQRQVLRALAAAPVFHVAVVDGLALGWGTEYMLCCDYRVATDHAVFGLPETGLGILPGAGGTHALWRHVGLAHALRLGMTGERIDADEAARIGLVQERVVALSDGLERARQLAAGVVRCSPTALAAFKRAALASAEGASVEAEALAYEHCVDTGQAAIGRASFRAIRDGEVPAWGPRVEPGSDDADET